MNPSIEMNSSSLVSKIKHYLITNMGKSSDAASDEELYRALSWSLREEIMINWTATKNTIGKKKVRKLYYLSMEFMPGRMLGNNLANLSALDLVKKVLKILNRDFRSIISMEPDIGIGNGGLGRLASCFLDSLATMHYPAVGYGMRYQYGIFEQEILSGVQIERPECWLLHENPWEFRKDLHAVFVDFGGTMHARSNGSEEKVFDLTGSEKVRALPYDYPIIGYNNDLNFSVLPMRLWSTKESPHNFQLQRYNAGLLDEASENTSLTDVLYPNDNHAVGKKIRLKQEFLLVSASLQDIFAQHLQLFGSIDELADKVRIQINDTHPALVIPELIRLLIAHHDMSFEKALEVTRACCSYTNHTVMKEALEEWNESRLQELLPRQYEVIKRLHHRLEKLSTEKFPQNPEFKNHTAIIKDGQIKMAHLAIFGTHSVNGVAKLHSTILKESMFKPLYELFPKKFHNVTNGVTQRRWLLNANPALADFITERIGPSWIKDFENIKDLKKFADDEASQKAFLDIKQKNKQNLLDHLSASGMYKKSPEEQLEPLTNKALFDVQIKRFHEYKRQLMNALHALMVCHDLQDNFESRQISRLVLFGGKAAPGYERAKDIIQLIYCLSRYFAKDQNISQKLQVIFFPNYNVSNAELIIPAADLSEQTSTAGMEASGTGNMKLSINGALTIGTNDGANIEMKEEVTEEFWPFSFGASAKENFESHATRSYDAIKFYENEQKTQKALDALIDGSLVENESESEALARIHASLLHSDDLNHRDKYFVLQDLMPYYETQKKVEELYLSPLEWARFALRNIASMGKFSADVSIKNYSEKIWGLSACPPLEEELNTIRKEYSDLDQCRIYPQREIKH